MFTLRLAKPQPDYVTYRERYKVDLPLQMAECEINYLRLNKLLGNSKNDNFVFDAGDVICIETLNGDHKQSHYLKIIERSPYTTTLQLQRADFSELNHWLKLPRLTVRMYHDAKLAEVLEWEGHKRLRPRYEYPNQAMYQADEKLQVNQFLGQWLTLCLDKGLTDFTFKPC